MPGVPHLFSGDVAVGLHDGPVIGDGFVACLEDCGQRRPADGALDCGLDLVVRVKGEFAFTQAGGSKSQRVLLGNWRRCQPGR
ncbi:hypothetical protein [Burkholderia perseverans]|uniref:hypothetical protein n=1 Tax=Burkholderia perseverans TaxID=2615214 RepID=UPI001FEFB6EB|nr:hypothetical protein [Burkholderia perseverans]